MVVNFCVQYFQDFELGFIADHDRQRWWLDSTRDHVWDGGFQHGDVEDWVYSTKAVRKSQSDGMGARLGNDLVRSKVLLREFLGGSCRTVTEELRLDECVAANFEFQSWKTARVSRHLVLTLSISYMLPKLSM